MEGLFFGVMALQEAKNHQSKLKSQGIELEFKTHHETCTSGCKVTVEVWGKESDKEALIAHFQSDFLNNVKGHVPNFEHMSAVFDPTLESVICQACGASFAPSASECPDCGLVY